MAKGMDAGSVPGGGFQVQRALLLDCHTSGVHIRKRRRHLFPCVESFWVHVGLHVLHDDRRANGDEFTAVIVGEMGLGIRHCRVPVASSVRPQSFSSAVFHSLHQCLSCRKQ